MRKLSKKLALVTALCVSSSIVMTALSGCKKKVEDTENVLEIHIVEAGYGYDWLNDAIDAFKNEAWVKEKYPNLVIPQLAHTSVDRTYGVTATIAGPSANTYDLFFGVDPYGSTPNVKDGNGNSYYEDLTSFYEMEIPGEEIAVKDKMRSDIYQYLDRPTSDGGTAIYGMPWVNPWMGLLYNKTLVDDIFGADYILYETQLFAGAIKGDFVLDDYADRALVFVNGERVGIFEQGVASEKITLDTAEIPNAKLQILVENTGRINYGPHIYGKKGIAGARIRVYDDRYKYLSLSGYVNVCSI